MFVLRQSWAALRALLVLTVVLGIAYPLLVTGVARAMPARADGSIVRAEGREVGSSLIGQPTSDAKWFAARPSAVDAPGAESGGSNLGQNADEQKKAITERRAALTKANPNATGPIPYDALTASGSGVDPDISVAYARWQAPRIAAARGMSVADVEKVIDAHIEKPALGYLGAERLNVLDLNVALAQRAAR